MKLKVFDRFDQFKNVQLNYRLSAFLLATYCFFGILKAQYNLNSMNQAIPTAFSAPKRQFSLYVSAALSWGMSYGLNNKTTLHAGNFLPVQAELYPVWTGLSIKRQIINQGRIKMSLLGGALTSFKQDDYFKHAYNAALLTSIGNEYSFLTFQLGLVKHDKNPQLPNSKFMYFSVGGRTPISRRWSFSGNIFVSSNSYEEIKPSGSDIETSILGGGMSTTIGIRRDWYRTSFYAGIIVAGIDQMDVPPIYPNFGFSFAL